MNGHTQKSMAVMALAALLAPLPVGTAKAASTYSDWVISHTGPVIYWNMDAHDGQYAFDASPLGSPNAYTPGERTYQASFSGAGPRPADGFPNMSPANLALTLDGNQDTIVNEWTDFNHTLPQAGVGTAAYSVQAWFNSAVPYATKVLSYVLGRGETWPSQALWDSVGVGGSHMNAGNLFYFNGNGDNPVVFTGTTTLSSNAWYHVLFVRDGDEVRGYLNGNLEFSGTAPWPGGANPGNKIVFGGRGDYNSVGTLTLTGRVDETAIWDRALTPADLPHLYQAPTQIPVKNHGFESPLRGDGSYSTNVVPGWDVLRGGGGNDAYITGTANPVAAEYTGAAGNGTPAGADGAMIMFTYLRGDSWAGAQQVVEAPLTEDKVYTLTVAVGERHNRPAADLFFLDIGTAGQPNYGRMIRHTGTPADLTPGEFTDHSVSYTALDGDPRLGENLRVAVFGQTTGGALERSTDFDNVRLTVQDRPAIALSNPLNPTVIVGAPDAQVGVTLTNSGADPADLFYNVANDSGVPSAGGTLLGNVVNRSVEVAIPLSAGTVGAHSVTFTATGTDRNNVAAFNNGAWLTSTLTVLDHSSAVFQNASGAAVAAFAPNSLTLDFGTVAEGAGGGYLSAFFDIFNEVTTPGFTAGLDLDEFVAVSGDTGTFSKHAGLDTFSNLAAGSGEGYEFRFDTTALGTFSATYQFRLSDQDLPGASDWGGEVRTLTLQGTVVPEPSAALLLLVALGCGLLVRRRR